MGDKELNKMAEELANTETKDQADQAAIDVAVEDLPDDQPKADPEALVNVAGMAVAIGGGLICNRVRVTNLERGEIDLLARAMVALAQEYGIGPQDAKTIAWLNLGGVTLAIIGNRERLAPPPDPDPDQGDQAAVADPPPPVKSEIKVAKRAPKKA